MLHSYRDIILKYDRPVPRYTSYPTAPHFQELQNNKTYLDWLQAIDLNEPLSLYLHVPYCNQLCWYCGCHTKVTKRYAPIEKYVHTMMQEIDILSEKFHNAPPISNIHFGGGSPGIVHSNDFDHLMKRIKRSFAVDKNAEIAIEIDPRNITERRAAIYAKHGVNRISLGVQDFDDRVLKAVNREQGYHLTQDAMMLFRKNGIENFNIDLLYGLPHQSLESMKRTIEKVISIHPNRISLFGYAHVPWIKKHMRLINEDVLPGSQLRYDLFSMSSDLLQKSGYVSIGIDHFAKSGDPLVHAINNKTMSRNFQGYTANETQALIGLGASAIGNLSKGYIQNAIDLREYEKHILAKKLPAQKYCVINKDDKIRCDIIENIMCYFEVDLNMICKKYSLPYDYFQESILNLETYCADNLIEIENQNIRIKPYGRAITRLVATEFDAYFNPIPTEKKHSRAI